MVPLQPHWNDYAVVPLNRHTEGVLRGIHCNHGDGSAAWYEAALTDPHSCEHSLLEEGALKLKLCDSRVVTTCRRHQAGALSLRPPTPADLITRPIVVYALLRRVAAEVLLLPAADEKEEGRGSVLDALYRDEECLKTARAFAKTVMAATATLLGPGEELAVDEATLWGVATGRLSPRSSSGSGSTVTEDAQRELVKRAREIALGVL